MKWCATICWPISAQRCSSLHDWCSSSSTLIFTNTTSAENFHRPLSYWWICWTRKSHRNSKYFWSTLLLLLCIILTIIFQFLALTSRRHHSAARVQGAPVLIQRDIHHFAAPRKSATAADRQTPGSDAIGQSGPFGFAERLSHRKRRGCRTAHSIGVRTQFVTGIDHWEHNDCVILYRCMKYIL